MSKEAEEIKRPNLRDYYPDIIIQSEEMIAAPKLLAYAKALEQYVKHLEENFSSPQDEALREAFEAGRKLKWDEIEGAYYNHYITFEDYLRPKLNK